MVLQLETITNSFVYGMKLVIRNCALRQFPFQMLIIAVQSGFRIIRAVFTESGMVIMIMSLTGMIMDMI